MAFDIMCDRKVVAKIKGNVYKLEPNIDKGDVPFGLFTDSDTEDVNAVWDWFTEDRVFPENRVDCKELLKEMGLDFYDPWAIVKKTGGSVMTDPWWLRVEDDWTYENHTVRGIMERKNREYKNRCKQG